MTQKIRVGVNGYGVIGKRVADAVTAQHDMELVGISDVVSDYRIATAVSRGIPVHASTAAGAAAMRSAQLPVTGELHQLLGAVDVIVDCTPARSGATNLEHYRAHGVRAVFQGGEKHALTGHSFVAHANYATALGRDTTRVVSCNTTATVRTLTALQGAGLLARARGVLIRRATDPWESDHSGIMNTVVPETAIPSHQGPDARTVVPDLDVVTMAAKGSHTQNHLHYWAIDLTRPATQQEVLEALGAMPRVALVRSGEGIVAPNSTIEQLIQHALSAVPGPITNPTPTPLTRRPANRSQAASAPRSSSASPTSISTADARTSGRLPRWWDAHAAASSAGTRPPT